MRKLATALLVFILLVTLSLSCSVSDPCKEAPWDTRICLTLEKELIIESDKETQAMFGEYLDQDGDYLYLAAHELFWYENKTSAHVYGYYVWDMQGRRWIDFGQGTEVWLSGVFGENNGENR